MPFKGKETTNARIIPTNPEGPKTKWRTFVLFKGSTKLNIDSSVKLLKKFGGKFTGHGFNTDEAMLFEIAGTFPTLKSALAFAKAIKKLEGKRQKKRKK